MGTSINRRRGQRQWAVRLGPATLPPSRLWRFGIRNLEWTRTLHAGAFYAAVRFHGHCRALDRRRFGKADDPRGQHHQDLLIVGLFVDLGKEVAQAWYVAQPRNPLH